MSTSDPVALPLAAQSCTLEPPQLHDQLERYRQLSRHTIGFEHQPGELVAQFSEDLPARLARTDRRDRAGLLLVSRHRLPRARPSAHDHRRRPDHDTTLAALFSVLSEPLGARFLTDAPQSTESGLASINTREREPSQCCEPPSPRNLLPAQHKRRLLRNRRNRAAVALQLQCAIATGRCVHPHQLERAHPRRRRSGVASKRSLSEGAGRLEPGWRGRSDCRFGLAASESGSTRTRTPSATKMA